MRFLRDDQILEEVRQLVEHDGELLAAVAYWGQGAGQETGITTRAKPTRILCDLFSGSCNPYEIRTLLESSNVEVRTSYGMHAKVWANGHHVIVGSANASMNGLGFEAGGCNVEAAVQLRNSAIADEVRKWFKQKWEASTDVNQQILDEAIPMWSKRQRNAPRAIMNYYIGAYSAVDPDDAECNAVHVEWTKRNPGADLDQRNYYCYRPEATVPLPGTVILDFTCNAKGEQFTFNSTWICVRSWRARNGSQVVDLERTNPRFPINRHSVEKMVACAVSGNCRNWDDDGWYLYKNFADFFYGTRARCRRREPRCENCPFRQEREV